MEIEYSTEAVKSLRRCDKRILVRQKIEELADDPSSLSTNIVKLQGRTAYRLRVQNWRVIFRMDVGVVHVETVLPRGSVYEVRK